MSGFIGAASSVYSAVAKILGPATLTLGNVPFSNIELPEKMHVGGKLALAKQITPDGIVVLSAMGVQYPDIEWSGYFEGASAIYRSRRLYTMLHSAAVQSLAWNERIYSVVVSAFTADDVQTGWIPYQIVCTVLRDETQTGAKPDRGLLAGVASDLSDAIGLAPAALSDLQTKLQVAQQAAQQAGAAAGGSSAALALQSSVLVAQGATSAAMSLAEGNMAGAALGIASAGLAAAAAVSAVAAAANLAAVSGVQGLLGRSSANLGNSSA